MPPAERPGGLEGPADLRIVAVQAELHRISTHLYRDVPVKFFRWKPVACVDPVGPGALERKCYLPQSVVREEDDLAAGLLEATLHHAEVVRKCLVFPVFLQNAGLVQITEHPALQVLHPTKGLVLPAFGTSYAALQVIELIEEDAVLTFPELVSGRSRTDRVALFLALLELFKLGAIDLEQSRGEPIAISVRGTLAAAAGLLAMLDERIDEALESEQDAPATQPVLQEVGA